MKLIVTGATGLVGSEVIRLALCNPAITSVVAIARKPVLAPANDVGTESQTSKLQSVILESWTSPYPESVIRHVKDADACIWALAVTPRQSKDMDFSDVTAICYDYTINGLNNMAAHVSKLFRFIYVSGVTVERDQKKTLPFMSEYRLMRGRVENAILDFAKQHDDDHGVEVTVAKPAGIESPGRDAIAPLFAAMLETFGHTPIVHLSELAAAMIEQCQHGITKDPLWGEDLVEIGQRALSPEDYLR
ncbi:MAG: hypothetical protein LQ350_004283 [Teloschistes chrysophthalmus]|nr:MAG: hypothetical protein LQ350_004283 [Niorma chrysophthalma]